MESLVNRSLDRREFFTWMAGAAAAALISSCTDSDSPPRRPGGVLAPSASTRPSSATRAPANPTAIIHDEFYKRHLAGTRHVESPRRCSAVLSSLKQDCLKDKLLYVRPRKARKADILTCHTDEYFTVAKRDVENGLAMLSTGDTNISKDSFDAALLAAGGAISAVDAVIGGKAGNAFCVIRPPGHHALGAKGMGFCIFNNVAVAARYAQKAHGVGRVLIVDWDVHHGNGTQEIFYSDPSVFYFSTHQSPWYPGTGRSDETGRGRAIGTNMNCPFPAGSGAKQIVGAFRDKLVPAAKAFRPELVLISAGFDSRRGDPLGMFTLTDDDFTELTRIMMGVADEYASGRIVSVLEGGYNLEGLARATSAHVKTLCGAV